MKEESIEKSGIGSETFWPSKMWCKLGETSFSETASIDLKKFCKPLSINSRLASWDPYESNTCRYFKNILFNLASSMPAQFFELYRRIDKTDLGARDSGQLVMQQYGISLT